MDDWKPVPTTPIDMTRTWTKKVTTTKRTRPDGSLRSNTKVDEHKKFVMDPNKDYRKAKNGDDVLKAKLRPTGVQLDLAEGMNHAVKPHYYD